MRRPPGSDGVSSKALPTRLTTSPEELWLSPTARVGFEHPTASAFSILAERTVVSVKRATHTQIFAALRVAAMPESNPYGPQRDKLAREGVEAIYSDYGLRFFPTAPSADDLAWFATHYTGELGAMRQRTQSGRVWRNIVVRGESMSVLAFWTPSSLVTAAHLQLITRAFALQSPLRTEYTEVP